VIVDLTQVLAGPYGTMLLADMGATVIKVEPPWGDSTRSAALVKDGASVPFQMVNRNKESLVLDLSHPEGATAFRRLVARVDVVVENYRPGTMRGLGLGYETLREIMSRRSIQKIWASLAASERMRLTRSSSAERNPTIVLTSSGKKATNAALMTLEVSPRPNQITMSGPSATLGSDWIPLTRRRCYNVAP
jgi:hypothetical protein